MSTDATIQTTTENLAKGSKETARLFAQSVEDVVWQSSTGREEFCSLCEAMGGAGWKSYESLNVYLNMAAQLPDEETLLGVGRLCRQLSGYSFEPTNRYLAFVSVVIELQRYESLRGVEQIAVLYQERYHHASGLLADYFAAAGVQVSLLEGPAFEAWLDAAAKLVDAHRNHIMAFFGQSRRSVEIDWHFFGRLLSKARAVASAYLEQVDTLRSLPTQFLGSVHDLIEHHVAGDILELIHSLASLHQFDEEEAVNLLKLAMLCPDATTAVILIERARQLPLARPDVVEQWLAAGAAEAAGNPSVREAWIGLESSKSVTCLEDLQGVVRFDDHQRILELIAEAIAGQRMLVGTADNDTGLRPDIVACNGRDIFLPVAVEVFDNKTGNFDFYRISLLHQLGFLEFGCFEHIFRVREYLAGFDDAALAQHIFSSVENARIDWLLEHRYPGIKNAMAMQKEKAWSDRNAELRTDTQQLLEALIGIGLDAHFEPRINNHLIVLTTELWSSLEPIRQAEATIDDAMQVATQCYNLMRDYLRSSVLDFNEEQAALLTLAELPEPVAFRGEMDMAEVESTLRIDALIRELEESVGDEKDTLSIGAGDPDQVDLSDLVEGEVGEGASITIEELARQIDVDKTELEAATSSELAELLGGLAIGKKEADIHRYDEWDHSINDYRSRWCTLHEYKGLDEDDEYFAKTLVDHQGLAQRIRQQLNRVRPEMLKKVRGFPEGEELDLERSVEFLVDKRARLTPDEKIYIQRQRKERDVATLFLLDMSASTDDIIADPENEPVIDPDTEDEDVMMEYFRLRKAYEESARRIIDLEKQSVILMTEALEKLGDAYSVCGFSGYGRDQVDYYLCKGFEDALDDEARRRIGGIKPCRSTRMGAPIRHATRQLLETGSRIKALIMISDGYPQDHDYGADRNSREYGLMDTMKALMEARQQGVLTYCLTVDPSGHDYLREMCPEGQYMVIQDIAQLPEELSRVYRSLTG